MDFLKGYRTKISGWLTAASGVLIMVGVEIDPAAMMRWLEQFNEALGVIFTLLGAAIHYYRKKASA